MLSTCCNLLTQRTVCVLGNNKVPISLAHTHAHGCSPVLFQCSVFPPPSQCYMNRVDGSSKDGQDRQFLVCFVCIGKQGLDLYPLVVGNVIIDAVQSVHLCPSFCHFSRYKNCKAEVYILLVVN